MKLNVGDYVRTKYGITQYKEYDTIDGKKILCMPVKDGLNGIFANLEDIIKSSPNIIDLIEVGDYVNGKPLDEGEFKFYKTYPEYIKSIVTKEQFKQMKYRVED